jgi:hypothetical protein
MPQSFFGTRIRRVLGAMVPGSRHQGRGRTIRRFPAVESLEQRALLSNITASGVLSSTPVGSSFSYTITLTNSSSSDSGIGTFWFAWTTSGTFFGNNPGGPENLLATTPSAVTLPSGWSDLITHSGPGDGYGIEFTATSSASSLQPGSSLNFGFQSSDTPASFHGVSTIDPFVPVGTSTVYPGAAFSDSGHRFVVAPATSGNPPPLVRLGSVNDTLNKKHLVTKITIDFSGPVNAAQAQSTGIYRLATAGKHGSFTAKNATIIKLRSAAYDSASDSVTLTPTKAFALTKTVQLVVEGQPPSGLQDSTGRLIDGGNIGKPGSNGVVLLTSKGVIL